MWKPSRSEAVIVPNIVRFLSAVCAPTMAIVARLIDSPEDRRDRARLAEFTRLQRQLRGPQR